MPEAGLDAKSLALLEKMGRSLKKGEDTLSKAVKELAIEAGEQMLDNLGGTQVSFSGGSFKINVVTGNLRRHTKVNYPFGGDPYTAEVSNDADYAEQVHDGISGPGKKELILNSGKKAKVNKEGRRYKRIPGGKGSLVPFWTLHEDSQLADQPGRPFASAVAEQMKTRAVTILGAAILQATSGKEG